jgi:diguanylate cyclase (GGDEF)-like protein
MDRRAPRRDLIGGASFVLAIALLTLLAIHFDAIHWPSFKAFVPICATLWCVADFLTAYFLFTQFSVNGLRAFALLGIAYGISGMLTIPYIAYFPGVFIALPAAPGAIQIAIAFWIVWHLTFPLIVGGYHCFDRDVQARVSSTIGVRRWLTGAIAGSVGGSVIIAAAIIGAQGHLPIFITNVGFSRLYQHDVAPLVAGVNFIAALAILTSRRRSRLQLWLSVALLIAALDGTLNALSGGRYFLTWYVGKLETLATAAVVLMVLLSELSALYGRLSTLATVDALTGLSNRQAFDNDARVALLLQQRRTMDVAFLVIDIDFFKQYNDTYGHLAGDACLTRVAHCIRSSCGRAVDLVGRFGGEEFVVLLRGTDALGAMRIAESIRACVEALGIPHAGSSAAPVVTVSVGVTQAHCDRDTKLETLFQRADAALYRAKRTRNAVVMDPDEDAHIGELVAETA